jgi:hypothetical protein
MPMPFQNPRRATLTGADATADRVERRLRLGWKCITVSVPFAGTMHARQEPMTYGAWRAAEAAVWLGPSTLNFDGEHCGLMDRQWRQRDRLRGNMGRYGEMRGEQQKGLVPPSYRQIPTSRPF